MTILKKLVVAGRKYQDKSGKDKTVWHTVGHLHETNDGSRQYITIDPMVNFAAFERKDGDDRVYVNMFDADEGRASQGAEPPASTKPPRPAQQPAGHAQSKFDDIDDDVPF